MRSGGLLMAGRPMRGCDSYRIQTCNLLIRSQMLYSVELMSLLIVCDSYRIQTCNLLIRSQMLYSVELMSQKENLREAGGPRVVSGCKGKATFSSHQIFSPLLKKFFSLPGDWGGRQTRVTPRQSMTDRKESMHVDDTALSFKPA